MLNYLTNKYSIPYDNEHILAHYEVDPASGSNTRKWDPSPNFDWAQIALPDHKRLKDVITKEECPSQINFDGRGYDCEEI